MMSILQATWKMPGGIQLTEPSLYTTMLVGYVESKEESTLSFLIPSHCTAGAGGCRKRVVEEDVGAPNLAKGEADVRDAAVLAGLPHQLVVPPRLGPVRRQSQGILDLSLGKKGGSKEENKSTLKFGLWKWQPLGMKSR